LTEERFHTAGPCTRTYTAGNRTGSPLAILGYCDTRPNPHCRSMRNELQCGDKLVRLSSWSSDVTDWFAGNPALSQSKLL